MKKIGLALGGGGARGLAHIGVIRALTESGIRPSCIVGTSIGAIVGAVAAAGNLETAASWAEEPNWKRLPKLFFDLHFTKRALINGDRIEGLLKEFLAPASDFADLAVPFAAVATDLATGEEVVMRSGELVSAVRASMSIPGVFSPVSRDGRVLVDGGLVDPLPVRVCREMGAEAVIAVEINGCGGLPELKSFDRLNLLDVLLGVFRIFNDRTTAAGLAVHVPDVLLQPPVADTALLDFRPAARLIECGRRTVLAARDGLDALLYGDSRFSRTGCPEDTVNTPGDQS